MARTKVMPTASPFPVLNWAELHRLVTQIQNLLALSKAESAAELQVDSPEVSRESLRKSPSLDPTSAFFVDKITVPARARCAVGSLGGYFKSEWAIKLTSRKQERVLLVSVRPQHCYLTLCEGKGPKAATATHSGFEMSMSKELRGKRLIKVEALPRERVVIFWFGQGTQGAQGAGGSMLGLALYLVPSNPEALLIEHAGDRATAGNVGSASAEHAGSAISAGAPYKILARSRVGQPLDFWSPPDGLRAPPSPVVREDLVKDPFTYYHAVEHALEINAFELRYNQALRALRESREYFEKRITLNETALRDALAETESHWKRYGDLLKGSLYLGGGGSGESNHDPEILILKNPETKPETKNESKQGQKSDKKERAFRAVYDFETEAWTEIPVDPKLSARAQVEKFYSLARRNERRREEAKQRLLTLKQKHSRIVALMDQNLNGTLPWDLLEKWEQEAGLGTPGAGSLAASASKADKKASALASRWEGRSCIAPGGWTILIGRNKNENLELTFKVARGNDLWFHVRGRPGAHVIIPVPSGKSVPLPVLLDAAMLTLFYSGGEKWGKTEVDYTYKKYVKRIKDSTEASYTQNKTLLVAVDQARVNELLKENF